jgi:peptide methionine sulfoxide reductase msrA/msrB
MLFGVLAGCSQAEARGKTLLTPEEEYVIVNKGTERPFTGKYYNHKEDGTYTCKRCGAELFTSDTKFDSGCGWPSFDDAIEGAVKEQTDADGRRTEIVCARCDGHLGHVFRGEGFTDKNTRHCVNSISLNFDPAKEAAAAAKESAEVEKGKEAKAIFAGGCFWGVEYYFQRAKGVISTEVGYTGGRTENPTYKEVCTKDTGHVEAMEVVYDPEVITFEELAKLFFETHDPTQVDRQGPDIGYQYRSMIFYLDDEQKQTSEKLIKVLEEKGLDVATELEKASKFWPAEDYHQEYYAKKNGTPYCHAYTKRF